MNLTLRAGEKLYLNGAVIRVDRKVNVELLNDATFLLEHHVMQASAATTPLRQIYFAIQIMVMDPANSSRTVLLVRQLLDSAIETYETSQIVDSLRRVSDMVESSNLFEALKAVRSLFAAESAEMDAAAMSLQLA